MVEKKQLNIDQLLLLSLSELVAEGRQTTFENLVVKCFELFPDAFGLKGFIKKYPDSSRVDKSWRRCRTDRSWISGSVAHGFAITLLGRAELKNVKKRLKVADVIEKDIVQHGDKRTKSGRVIERIEKHKAFLRYLQDKKNVKISDYEVCDILFCTLDSFAGTRRKNLNELKNLVGVYERKDLLVFLEWIEKSKSHLFCEK